jgi:hypothetical protein
MVDPSLVSKNDSNVNWTARAPHRGGEEIGEETARGSPFFHHSARHQGERVAVRYDLKEELSNACGS